MSQQSRSLIGRRQYTPQELAKSGMGVLAAGSQRDWLAEISKVLCIECAECMDSSRSSICGILLYIDDSEILAISVANAANTEIGFEANIGPTCRGGLAQGAIAPWAAEFALIERPFGSLIM